MMCSLILGTKFCSKAAVFSDPSVSKNLDIIYFGNIRGDSNIAQQGQKMCNIDAKEVFDDKVCLCDRAPGESTYQRP